YLSQRGCQNYRRRSRESGRSPECTVWKRSTPAIAEQSGYPSDRGGLGGYAVRVNRRQDQARHGDRGERPGLEAQTQGGPPANQNKKAAEYADRPQLESDLSDPMVRQ